jgi:hypothetical protein
MLALLVSVHVVAFGRKKASRLSDCKRGGGVVVLVVLVVLGGVGESWCW